MNGVKGKKLMQVIAQVAHTNNNSLVSGEAQCQSAKHGNAVTIHVKNAKLSNCNKENECELSIENLSESNITIPKIKLK